MPLYLSQRDPRWATQRLGKSNFQMGRWGCTTTALSMLSERFGFYVPPNEIAKRSECYNMEGKILWGELDIPHVKYQDRIRFYAPGRVLMDVKDKSKGVLLEVNFGQHWILADRKMLLRNDYVCADPWTGKACAAIGDYHNITGSAHFVRV